MDVYLHALADRHTHGDTDLDSDSDADRDAHFDPDSDSHSDGDTDLDSDADGDPDSDVDADFDPDSDADEHVDRDADCDADTHRDCNADPDDDSDVHRDGHPNDDADVNPDDHAYVNLDPDVHANAYSDTDSNAHADPDAIGYRYPDPDTDPDTHAHAYADTDRHSHSDGDAGLFDNGDRNERGPLGAGRGSAGDRDWYGDVRDDGRLGCLRDPGPARNLLTDHHGSESAAGDDRQSGRFGRLVDERGDDRARRRTDLRLRHQTGHRLGQRNGDSDDQPQYGRCQYDCLHPDKRQRQPLTSRECHDRDRKAGPELPGDLRAGLVADLGDGVSHVWKRHEPGPGDVDADPGCRLHVAERFECASANCVLRCCPADGTSPGGWCDRWSQILGYDRGYGARFDLHSRGRIQGIVLRANARRCGKCHDADHRVLAKWQRDAACFRQHGASSYSGIRSGICAIYGLTPEDGEHRGLSQRPGSGRGSRRVSDELESDSHTRPGECHGQFVLLVRRHSTGPWRHYEFTGRHHGQLCGDLAHDLGDRDGPHYRAEDVPRRASRRVDLRVPGSVRASSQRGHRHIPEFQSLGVQPPHQFPDREW